MRTPTPEEERFLAEFEAAFNARTPPAGDCVSDAEFHGIVMRLFQKHFTVGGDLDTYTHRAGVVGAMSQAINERAALARFHLLWW